MLLSILPVVEAHKPYKASCHKVLMLMKQRTFMNRLPRQQLLELWQVVASESHLDPQLTRCLPRPHQ